jgi:hypothetical protein
MDFLTLLGLGLYGNTVNKYDEYIEYKNELGNIPRYYDNIYSCNQINNNRKKVYLKASNNYLKSLEPNTNIINNIWRLQKNDTYNQIPPIQPMLPMPPIQPIQEGEIREPFITGGIRTFFDRIRNYSLISVICLIVLSCLFCCM